jgi:vacuolar-type H+-ATPase subunit E/Vma4
LSLSRIRSEIDKKTEEEISKILEDAKDETEGLIAQANARAEAIRKERTSALAKELDEEERSQLAILRMNLRGELLTLKQKLRSRVSEQAEAGIEQLVQKDGPEYRELLRKLMLEGIANLKGNKFIVETNSRDQEIIAEDLRIISEKATTIKKERVQLQTRLMPKTGLGGVVIHTDDETQQYDNSLDARLFAASQNLAGQISKILFGTGESSE